MRPRELEKKHDIIRAEFYAIHDDNEAMFFALEDIYNLCIEADENNWAKTIDAIKEIAGRLT